MNVTELVAQLGETRAQVLLRDLKCQTAEELVDLARENGLSVSQEEAGNYSVCLLPVGTSCQMQSWMR